MQKQTVAVLGDVNVDLLLDVPELPDPGGEAIARRQRLQLGGSVTNTAVMLSRLGTLVRLAGRIGDDANGRLASDALRAEGIGLDDLTVDPAEPTSVNVVVVTDDGERTMYAYRGANAQLSPEHLGPQLMVGVAVLHLSGYAMLADPQRAAAWRAVESAISSGAAITLDVPVCGATEARAETLRLIGELDLIIVGVPELLALAGASGIEPAVAALAGATDAAIIVKAGALGGCWFPGGGGDRTEVPALTVEPVDTTGAGDAFAAGLVHGLTAGLDETAALVLANTLGALTVTRRGAGPSLPTISEVVIALRAGWTGSPELASAADRAASTVAPASIALPAPPGP